MIIIEKNKGEKIAYTQSGTVIGFAGGRLALDCALYQKDWDVHLDVCANADGNLVIGTESGQKYVAQLDIPAHEYRYPENTETTPANLDDEDTEDYGTERAEAEPPVLLPLDMEKVTLSLWAIDV